MTETEEEPPIEPKAVTFQEISTAAYLLKSGIVRTDCSKSEQLSELTGMQIYVKKEFLQATGSFKDRGARFALLNLSAEQKAKGVIAASSGDHVMACCYHGHRLGIPVTVILPLTASLMKIQSCRKSNGTVIIEGKNVEESQSYAKNYAKEHDLTYISGYDHPDVLAGQGTVALEIWDQVPNVDAVICPVGGGGLLAGTCVAMKTIDHTIKVIAVEPERSQTLTKALTADAPVDVKVQSTLADGLAVKKLGVNAFESIKNRVDKVVLVTENMLAVSILRLIECEKSIIEGAGAAPLAAVLSGKLESLKGMNVVLILSAGNIDTPLLGRVIDRGLTADGRLVKVKVTVSDRPGGISELCELIEGLGATIKDVMHERAWLLSDVFSVEVKVICETRDHKHSMELRDALFKKYNTIVFNKEQYPFDSSPPPRDFAAPADESGDNETTIRCLDFDYPCHNYSCSSTKCLCKPTSNKTGAANR